MALQITAAKRKFIIEEDKIELIDPNPTMDLQQVVNHYSSVYPQLINATISGPEMEGDCAVYTLTSIIGTKG